MQIFCTLVISFSSFNLRVITTQTDAFTIGSNHCSPLSISLQPIDTFVSRARILIGATIVCVILLLTIPQVLNSIVIPNTIYMVDVVIGPRPVMIQPNKSVFFYPYLLTQPALSLNPTSIISSARNPLLYMSKALL